MVKGWQSASTRRATRHRVRVLNRAERTLAAKVASDPLHLHHFERSASSQNGEDGLLAEIFSRIGPKDRSLVEIGASDGTENCTRALIESGWHGVWLEADQSKALAARRLFGDGRLVVVKSFVDRESILAVLDQANVSATPDLLVIDIDGNDYWIWETVSSRYRPRVVVIEYNAAVGPRRHWVMPYDPNHQWDETSWHGASLTALAALGSRLGYTLIGCDSQGVNAFFVSSSEARSFALRPVRYHYVAPRYALPFGHPPARADEIGTPLPSGDAWRSVQLNITTPMRRKVRPGGHVYVHARIKNGTTVPIGSAGSTPVRLASYWLDERGQRVAGEPERSIQPWKANAGASAHLVGRARAPTVPGRYMLVFALVQESVRWFDEPSGTQVAGTWSVTPTASAPSSRTISR
jgi:hypothetical protein